MSQPRVVCSRVTRWLWGLGLGMAVISGQADGPAPSYVAGDLIVKFKETSEFGQQLARAARGDGLPEKNLSAVATQLSMALGIALDAVRATSGRELVLTIDRPALLRSLARQVSRDPAVQATWPVDVAQTVLPAAHIALGMDLVADSEAQRLVQQAVQSGRRTTYEINALVAEMAAGASPLPSGHVDKQGKLILRIDLAALTRDLVARLHDRPDVDYAQVSLLVKPYGKL